MHVGNRLYRSFFGGERSGHAGGGGGGQGPLGQEVAGDGEEVLAQCLAKVLRAGVDGSEGGGAAGAASISPGTADDIPGATPIRPASRPPRSARNAAVPSNSPDCLGAAPTVIHCSRPGSYIHAYFLTDPRPQAGIDARENPGHAAGLPCWRADADQEPAGPDVRGVRGTPDDDLRPRPHRGLPACDRVGGADALRVAHARSRAATSGPRVQERDHLAC